LIPETGLKPALAGKATSRGKLADAWDRRIEADIKAGRLDEAGRRADADFEAGRCKPL
jgi:hypothetical protein